MFGTFLLMLPISNAEGISAPWLTALFTAVSAVCVTGLVIVDTGSYWSSYGQVVILILFQIGGFGMMTAGTLLGLLVNNSLRLRTKLIAQVETHALGLGDVTGVTRLVLKVTVLIEFLVFLILMFNLHFNYQLPWSQAAWSGLFHSISAFNNAGFSIYADSLMRFANDIFILLPIMVAIVIGGIGFPVFYDIRYKLRDSRHWSIHTKITIFSTFVLLGIGFFAILIFEWSNPKTIGQMSIYSKILSAAFASVSARTAGFNSLDIGLLSQESWALHYFLMFIGGGSAGTAGGVKVGTAFLLGVLVFAEIRGRTNTQVFGRRIGTSAQRQAITVLVLGLIMVVIGNLVILRTSDFPTDQVIFEVISAFGTVGLSTGITANLPFEGKITIILLMFFGRVGLITIASSLILNERRISYRFPKEDPIVG